MSVLRLTDLFNKSSDGSVRPLNLVRYLFMVLVFLGVLSAFATYSVLSHATPISATSAVIWPFLAINMIIILGLLTVLRRQLLVVGERRRAGVAGAALRGRIIILFSMFALMPALLVAFFAYITLDRGLDQWLSNRTKMIVESTSNVTNAYLAEQRNGLRVEMNLMASDLSNAHDALRDDKPNFTKFLQAQAGIRNMQQAVLINRAGNVQLAASPETELLTLLPPPEAFAASNEKTVIITSMPTEQVLALRKIDGVDDLFLYVSRMMAPGISQQIVQTENAMRDYSAMENSRLETQLAFTLIYIVLTLVILLSAIWIGMILADRLVSPIGRLIQMTQKLGDGDLNARVDPDFLSENSELKQLSQNFNDMAERIGAQQSDLKIAHANLDDRIKLTEAVLAGVSSGVVGVSEEGIIDHANDVAGSLYNLPAEALIGKKLDEAMPEFVELTQALSEKSKGPVSTTFDMSNSALSGRIIRAAAQTKAGPHGGTIISFDDITDLLTAQRNAAWSDIAQRIAHEIKNPLTPIQLSAERLQGRFGKSDAEAEAVFRQCTDTIIRQVEDIGSMVDEFASFARMPAARMGSVNLADIVSQTVLLQRVGHRDVTYSVGQMPDLDLVGDRRLLSQALLNVLKNAEEAVRHMDGEKRIEIAVTVDEEEAVLSVSDTGNGWPSENRYDLLEPYNTSREEGTGLGLSIVKKIIDDHGGKLFLSDAPWCASGGTGAMLQMVLPLRPPEVVGESKVLEEL